MISMSSLRTWWCRLLAPPHGGTVSLQHPQSSHPKWARGCSLLEWNDPICFTYCSLQQYLNVWSVLYPLRHLPHEIRSSASKHLLIYLFIFWICFKNRLKSTKSWKTGCQWNKSKQLSKQRQEIGKLKNDAEGVKKDKDKEDYEENKKKHLYFVHCFN